MNTQQSNASGPNDGNFEAADDINLTGESGSPGTARIFPALMVDQLRAGLVDRTSEIHAIVVNGSGRLLAHFGGSDTNDAALANTVSTHANVSAPGHAAFLHDLAKVWQVLPLLDRAPDLKDDEIAIAVSTHSGEAGQRRAVESLLRKSGSSANELMVSGRDPLLHPDSGTHAALLLSCVRNGWSKYGYRNSAHPLQIAIRSALATALGVEPSSMVSTPDDNGLPTFGMSLLAIANLVRKTPDRIRTAVQSNPHLSGGLHRPDTDLMLAQNKWFAKAANEGLFVARHETGLTVALKALNADCASIRPAFAMILDVIAGQQANGESMSETSRNPLASVLRDIEARQYSNGAVWGGWGVSDLEISEAQLSDFAVPHWRTTPVTTVHGDQVGSIEARPIPRDQVIEIAAEPSVRADDQPADSREISLRKPRMPLAISTKGERFDRFETYLSDLFAPITAASLADSEAPDPAHAVQSTHASAATTSATVVSAATDKAAQRSA